MNWAVAVLIILLVGGVYKVASDRGKRKASKTIQDREEAVERIEVENELKKKQDANAWDNLNDTIDRNSSGKN